MKYLKWMIVFFTIVIFYDCTNERMKTAKMDAAEISESNQITGSSIDTSQLTQEEPADTLLSGRIRYTLPYPARQGKRLFQKYCMVCHGESGRGDGFNAWNLQPRPRDLTDPEYLNALTNERIAQAIREGGAEVQKSNLMPAWGQTLSKTEIQQLVAYLRTLSVKVAK